MVWYTGVDKDIYESGVHFRPQQRYLTTDYVWPTEGGDAGGGGGSGIPAAANYVNQDQSNYSVYNPDPNRTTFRLDIVLMMRERPVSILLLILIVLKVNSAIIQKLKCKNIWICIQDTTIQKQINI